MAGFGGMVASYVARAGRFDAYLAVAVLVLIISAGIIFFERAAPIHELPNV
jgi:hypothetical protein